MTTETEAPLRRPVIVTIAVVLLYVSGLLNIVVGVLVLLSRYQVAESEVLGVSLLGAAITLFGLLTIGIASAIARGSRLARLFVTLYIAVQIALHVATIVVSDVWDWTEIVQIVAELVVVIALWTPPGTRYFRRPPAPVATV
ncbi:hypothetical protein ASD65_07310 [Microbacterium sp. Root61]|uniref:hypothetical protein n=1 Tax=Microbacterium sp. Root61 TaxID=1736570 RepID=UPI0006FE9180|nr:hypothetical protein [Microbacterium sp. Root61]KRA24249.1 hypothetical protein ASD65_07310 [Microbacterium sp. Root61]